MRLPWVSYLSMLRLGAAPLIPFLWIDDVPKAASEAFKAHWTWKAEASSTVSSPLTPGNDGTIVKEFEFPGGCLLFRDRSRFLPTNRTELFDGGRVDFLVKADFPEKTELKAMVFLRDKDGDWWQSPKIVSLRQGVEESVGVSFASMDRELLPVGHGRGWTPDRLASVSSVGLSLYSQDKMTSRVQCRLATSKDVRPEPKPSLSVLDLVIPDTGRVGDILEGGFFLTRDYYNPFDTGEILVDFEVEAPADTARRYPAYFTQREERSQHHNTEVVSPVGVPSWAFRYNPTRPGLHRLRLIVEDRTGASPLIVESPWRTVVVEANPGFKGYVRVSESDKRYLSWQDGSLFFPVGMNIHTPKDVRSEKSLDFGRLPDRGTYAYEEYFKSMSENGMNACEVWMASWSLALEWTSGQKGYQGLGRYNLENAAGLDHVLKTAAGLGINVHLTLDNHGKLSANSDQEWVDCPYNVRNLLSAADGAFLTDAGDFFENRKAIDLTKRRNRYVAARWGAFANIFGVELWSELDLVTNHRAAYDKGESEKWHEEIANHFRSLDQGAHLIDTHFCGDYKNTVNHQKLYWLKSIDFVVGDAYRGAEHHFVDFMRRHEKALVERFGKPVLCTEYGGTPWAGDQAAIEGDLHCGVWAPLFAGQAGSAFLWWHDFVHKRSKYQHFKGFSEFIRGVDPRGWDNGDFLVVKNPPPDYEDGSHLEYNAPLSTQYSFPMGIGISHLNRGLAQMDKGGRFILNLNKFFPPAPSVRISIGMESGDVECLWAGNSSMLVGWIFDRERVRKWPADDKLKEMAPSEGLVIILDYPIWPGKYSVEFRDTLTNGLVEAREINIDRLPFKLVPPPFKIDMSMKCVRIQ